MGFPLYVICYFSLAPFNVFPLNLIFVSLISMCLGVFLHEFILCWNLCAFWISIPISFSKSVNVFTIASSNVFSYLFSSSSVVFVVQLLSHVRLFANPGLKHAMLLCPPLSAIVFSNSCPVSQLCYLTISSSSTSFFFCL